MDECLWCGVPIMNRSYPFCTEECEEDYEADSENFFYDDEAFDELELL